MYVYMYVYIYIYTYIHIHIYVNPRTVPFTTTPLSYPPVSFKGGGG